jgi:hypothetical protein
VQVAAIRQWRQVVLWAAACYLAVGVPPGWAAFDLFAAHEVTVQFATGDGKPMAHAEVRIFAPGEPDKPYTTGRTGADGKFEFSADRDGFWSAEARTGSEVARVSIRVGGAADQRGGGPSPVLILGGLAVLLVIALWYRVLRARARRRRS